MEDNNGNNQQNKTGGEFGLPQGYFERSAASILNKVEWTEEHKNYPNLLNLKEENGFILPENYFSTSESRIEVLFYPKLSSIQKENCFSVPENYFKNAEYHLSSRIGNTGELSEYPFLGNISRQNKFETEENYFSTNKEQLKKILGKKQEAKIIPLMLRRVSFATAAILLVALSVWVYNYYFAPVELKDCGTIACVDRIDLVKSKNLEVLDNDELYELVNPGDLEKNLERDENKKEPINTKDTNFKDVSTEDLLDEI